MNQNLPSIPPRSRRYLWLLLLLSLLWWAANATEVDIPRLITDAGKAREIVGDLLHPSLLARGDESQEAFTRLEVPCVTGEGPAPSEESGPTISLSAQCLNAREGVTVSGSGFRPNSQGRLYWHPPGGEGRLRDERIETDDQGAFLIETDIPPLLEERGVEALALAAVEGAESEVLGVTELQALVSWESGRLRPSDALDTTINAIVETIFLALMATTVGAILAFPISFLAARNLMPRTPLGDMVYGVTRTILNATRSIEPLILATIFAIWVGFGPFAGVLALSVSTIANIGKLYAESAESIDTGPMEAIRATGASELEVIRYAVIPQIVPPYLSFTIYYWDINVRMSTIIGFVGGGGIGLELSRWINQLQWNNAATGVWAIVIVVMLMDYMSAVVRERLI